MKVSAHLYMMVGLWSVIVAFSVLTYVAFACTCICSLLTGRTLSADV